MIRRPGHQPVRMVCGCAFSGRDRRMRQGRDFKTCQKGLPGRPGAEWETYQQSQIDSPAAGAERPFLQY